MGPDGSIIGREPAGGLTYSRLEEEGGFVRWTSNMVPLGGDFRHCRRLANAGGGTLYCLDPSGSLWWHRWVGETEKQSMAAEPGVVVARDWGRFRDLVAGPDGVLYGIMPDGSLFWHRRAPDSGTSAWADGSGTLAGSGFLVLE